MIAQGGRKVIESNWLRLWPFIRKKLTQKERLVGELMLAMLEWAAKHPTRWPEWSARGGALLEKRGVIEIWPEKNQYRLKPRST